MLVRVVMFHLNCITEFVFHFLMFQVARLQLQISDILAKNRSKYPGSHVDQALEQLNAQLYEISVVCIRSLVCRFLSISRIFSAKFLSASHKGFIGKIWHESFQIESLEELAVS